MSAAFKVGDPVDLLLCGKVKDAATEIKAVKFGESTGCFIYQLESRGYTWFSESLIRPHRIGKE